MTFEKANELIKTHDVVDNKGMKAFGCTYFHNICIKCKHKPQCNRKEPLIEKCNFFYEAEEEQI